MFDKVITTERNIKNALSRLIDNDPYKQLCWVEENVVIDNILELKSVGEVLYAASDLEPEYVENYVPEYLICPIFMVAYVGKRAGVNNTVEKYIDWVDFCKSTGEIQESVACYVIDTAIKKNDIHIFKFKDEEGFVEIPFNIGYYIPTVSGEYVNLKEPKEKLISPFDKYAPKMPYKVYFDNTTFVDMAFKNYEWSDRFNKKMEKSDFCKCLFVEMPGIWSVSYYETWIEEPQDIAPIWDDILNFEDIIETVMNVMRVRFDEFSGPPDVIVSNEWYSYRFVYNTKDLDELDLDDCIINFIPDDDRDFIANLSIYVKPLFD